MSIIEQIRAYVESRKNTAETLRERNICIDIIEVIDYIQEKSEKPINPICEELEEEIKRWLKEGEITDTRFDDYDDNDIEATARHFAQWQKEQMMKEAYIESRIVDDGRMEIEGNPLPCLNPIILLPYPQFKPGDRVRIIIIKEDNQ